MRGFFDNFGIEIAIGILGLVGSFLAWILGRISKMKEDVRKETLESLDIDVKQDNKLIKLETRLDFIQTLITKINEEIEELKKTDKEISKRFDDAIVRVETKLDRLYNLVVELAAKSKHNE